MLKRTLGQRWPVHSRVQDNIGPMAFAHWVLSNVTNSKLTVNVTKHKQSVSVTESKHTSPHHVKVMKVLCHKMYVGCQRSPHLSKVTKIPREFEKWALQAAGF